MKRLKWFIIPAVILLLISIIQKPQSQIIELGSVSSQNKAAISDSIGWIHTWAGTDSVKINFLRIFAEDDSVKTNFLRIAAERDTSNYNDTWISWLAKYADWDEAHTRVGDDSANFNAAWLRVAADSANWNTAYVLAAAESVKVNNLRIWAETDSSNYNLGFIKGTIAHTRVAADSVNWNLGFIKGTVAHTRVTADSANWNSAYIHSQVALDSVITGVIGYKRRTYLNVDSDRTLSVAESGSFFVVTNIAAKRRYTLPPAAIGLEFTFWVEDNDSLIIDGYTTNGIKNLTNAYERFAATDGVLKIIAANATTWFVVTEIGTWTSY